MKKNKIPDIILNVILPIITGIIIYKTADLFKLPTIIRNYLPDGLWAYSFLSCILIIWKRELNYVWITGTFLCFLLFELLQFLKIIAGTGDFSDLISYFVFAIPALATNKFFAEFFKY